MMPACRQLICCLMVACWSEARALEELTHANVLTREAANRSVLQMDATVLRNVGIDKSITDTAQKFPNSRGESRTVRDLLEDGSRFEDNVSLLPLEVRVAFHFYNPVTGQGLSHPPRIPVLISSPDWALARRGSLPGILGIGKQEFSYWDARQYLLDALTKESEAERKKAFGLAFQTLGHVVHHLQDMAQPQHVRNDVHCREPICELVGAHVPSLFEKWTDKEDVRPLLPVDPASIGYDITGSSFISTFNTPRRFWHTELSGENSPALGKGIAEFTNGNFLSAGTNFGASPFSSPVFDVNANVPPTAFTVEQLCANANPTCPPSLKNGFPQAKITFYASAGRDNFLDKELKNPRASTESLFDQALEAQGERSVLTLNRFNFEEAYKHLMPRAVAYSAGTINYFFRGKLDFKKDEKDAGKFRIVNLSKETMSGRFALYYDAKDGNRYPVIADPADPADPKAWRLTIAALDPTVPNSNLSEAISFIPPVNDGSPISPKAANEYMLVFSGSMGEEREDRNNGMIGAVAAKAINVPYNGALYVLGADRFGQRIPLVADKTGTRIATAQEFHPLRNLVLPPGLTSISKVKRSTQVAFTQHTFGYSYETLMTTVGIFFSSTFPAPRLDISPTTWVKDPATNTMQTLGGIGWTARSPDPQVGKFRFRPTLTFTTPRSWALSYTRTYQDAAGNLQSAGGLIPLPALPTGETDPRNVYDIFNTDRFFISGDGLRISGFQTFRNLVTNNDFYAPAISQTGDNYDLIITLAEVPSLAPVKTGDIVLVDSHTVRVPPTQNILPTSVIGTATTTATCDSPPSTFTGKVIKTDSLADQRENRSETVPIGYFNGELRSYRNIGSTRRLGSVQSVDANVPVSGPSCIWLYLQSKGQAINTTQVDGEIVFGNGSLVTEIRSKGDVVQTSVAGFAANRSWDYFYEGVAPAPPRQDTLLPAPVSERSYVLQWALTDRVEDAIYSLSDGSTSALKFRSDDITAKEFVADASPIGEVFFATTDLSILIHEPKLGPTIVVPPHVVRLMGAVWF